MAITICETVRIAARLLPGYGDEQFTACTVLYSVLPRKEFQGATLHVAQHLWKVKFFFNSSASLHCNNTVSSLLVLL